MGLAGRPPGSQREARAKAALASKALVLPLQPRRRQPGGDAKASAAAVPAPALPHGCVVIPKDILQFLESEARPEARRLGPDAALPKAEIARRSPGIGVAASHAVGGVESAVAGGRRAAARRAIDAGVGTSPRHSAAENSIVAPLVAALVGKLPPTSGAQHAGVGMHDGVGVAAEAGGDAPAARRAAKLKEVAPPSPQPAVVYGARLADLAGGGPGPPRPSPAESTPAAIPARERAPLVDFVQQLLPQGAPAQAVPESPHSYGRCDLFSVDRDAADQARERRRQQAQMLAEQIEEQRKRKEEERRRLQEQERLEDLRFERERRELLQEALLRDQRAAAKVAAADPRGGARGAHPQAGVPGAIAGGGGEAGNTRRRRNSRHDVNEAADTRMETVTAAQWTTSPENPERAHRRRRRRQSRTANMVSTSATWRTAEHTRRTWDDGQDDDISSVRDPDMRNSPTPWPSTNPPAAADSDMLRPVREDALHHHRSRRTRRENGDERDSVQGRRTRRERGPSSDANTTPQGADRWVAPPTGATRTTNGEGERVWAEDGAEPRVQHARPPQIPSSRRRSPSRRARSGSHEGAAEGAAAYSAAAERGERGERGERAERPAGKLSEDDLREQLGSLLRVCEHLLRDRDARERELRGLEAAVAAAGLSPRGQPTPRPRGRPAALGEVVQGTPHHDAGSAPSHIHSLGEGLGQAPPSVLAGPVAFGGGFGAQASPSVLGHGAGPRSVFDGRGAHAQPQIDEWPPDALAVALASPPALAHPHAVHGQQPGVADPLQVQARQGYAVPAGSGPGGFDAGPDGLAGTNLIPPPSPFTANVWGMPRLQRGSMGRNSLLASPPPLSRGGLNVQAHWPAFGGRASPMLMPTEAPGGGGGGPGGPGGPGGLGGLGGAEIDVPAKSGAGQIPIGIRLSIQAQSAMLRQLYPHGALAAGPAGPMPF